MIYRRFILTTDQGVITPMTKVFFYLCQLSGNPKIQIGLGYESVNGLQKRHHANWNVRVPFLLNLADDTEELLRDIKTGPLSEFFITGDSVDLRGDAKFVKKVSKTLRAVHCELVSKTHGPMFLGGYSLRDVLAWRS